MVVAQTAYPSKLLCKQNYPDRQVSYDNVKMFNFFEVNIWCLDELYSLSKRMLDKPRCCFIRALIKDENNRRKVVRKCNDEDATLIVEPCNWFALDIDWKEQESSGNLKVDANTVLLALPACFRGVECFVVASGSYGIKPGIRMRMFFWSRNAVAGTDLKKLLSGYEKIADPAIFNPIQPIYTAKPIFHGIDDPVKQRICWITPLFVFSNSVEIVAEYQHAQGMPEIWYTKRRAEQNAFKHYERIKLLSPGDRHNGLIKECYALGKLVGQGHFDRATVVQNCLDACDEWHGRRTISDDINTITYAIDKGIDSMGER